MTPKYSLVIINYNSGEFLSELINSMKKPEIPTEDMEIIVVDNSSTDDSVDRVKWGRISHQIIFNTTNRGFTAANNQAIKLCRGEYVVLINPDVRLCNDIFNRMREEFLKGTSAGICGPAVYNPDGTSQVSCFSFPSGAQKILFSAGIAKLFSSELFRRIVSKTRIKLPDSTRVFLENFGKKEEAVEVPWLSSVCMMIRREVFDRIGYFDETFFMYAGDEDFCLRASMAGYKIYYVPKARIIHNLGWKRGARGNNKKKDMYFKGFAAYYKKHFSGPKKALFLFLNEIDKALNRVNN
ncbi:MAG TPA: glycosyltransferase family 2 protein [Candidatus Omnitrophota bacterium]|nr:glycosyltransferase family 2 protein [Candidatus Omnitrophota bacterium]HPS20369.1 glycosyltransferase family 2 protein [Candidatus Omnitrophota bacterium]